MAGAALVRRVLWLACTCALLLGAAEHRAYAAISGDVALGHHGFQPPHQAPPDLRATLGHTLDSADPVDESDDVLDAQLHLQPPAVTSHSLPAAPTSWQALSSRHDDAAPASHLPFDLSSPRAPPVRSRADLPLA